MINIFEYFLSGEKFYVKNITPVCEKYSLTYMEFTVLMFLANNEGFDTATEIVNHRNIAKSHVSKSVRSLEDKGLLSCYQIGDDRRTVHLKVEDRAKQIIEEGKRAQNLFKDRIFENISQESIQNLLDTLNALDENIKKYSKN